jgi:glucose-6-phosphate dehydrogenase assembly protein OpcA
MSQKIEVAIPDIESKLTSLWEASQGPHAATDKIQEGKIKAGLFNLVIYSPSLQAQESMRKVTQSITHKFPCRAIFIAENPALDMHTVRTLVQVENLTAADPSVTCDQLYIEFSGQGKERVPFLVLPHLLPDLPVYLFWIGAHATDKAIFQQLAQTASNLIFYPLQTAEIPEFGHFVQHLLRRFTGNINDLAWAMTREWRQAITAAFSVPDHLASIQSVKSLRVTSASNIGVPAAYLQGWIAAQLEWTFVRLEQVSDDQNFDRQVLDSPEKIRLIYHHLNRDIEVLLNTEAKTAVSNALTEVEIIDTQESTFCFSLDAAKQQIKVKIWSTQLCEIPYSVQLYYAQPEVCFAYEIFQKSVSEHYRRTLHLISEINWGVS